MFRHVLHRWQRPRPKGRKPIGPPRHQPKIEDLEDRCVPAILFDHANLARWHGSALPGTWEVEAPKGGRFA